ncbi:MAG: VWA domain-containing protein [Succinimonas sp.]|nr:VWA domain-containing protein [Succinimonas sp.]
MVDFAILRDEDLINNPTPRVAVCFCLDVSGSMRGERINELNNGLSLFFDVLRKDEVAMYAAEIAVITFGGDSVECLRDFTNLSLSPEPPVLRAKGRTLMGEAVNLALEKLNHRKEEYRNSGVDYYQPWLILMSDGVPERNNELIRAKEATKKLITEKKLSVFSIGIGKDADMNELSDFSLPKRPALKLSGLKFREFFEWISKSVSKTSQSIPGENVKLDVNGIAGWAEL